MRIGRLFLSREKASAFLLLKKRKEKAFILKENDSCGRDICIRGKKRKRERLLLLRRLVRIGARH
jgi:hypothetical protein